MRLVDELADAAAATLTAGTATARLERVGAGVLLGAVQVMWVMRVMVRVMVRVMRVVASAAKAAIFRAGLAVVVRGRPREHHHARRASRGRRRTADLEGKVLSGCRVRREHYLDAFALQQRWNVLLRAAFRCLGLFTAGASSSPGRQATIVTIVHAHDQALVAIAAARVRLIGAVGRSASRRSAFSATA